MRVLIDLQPLQGINAHRGIGRYCRSLIEGILRNAPGDDFVLLLNGMMGEDNGRLRREFAQKWPKADVRTWTAAPPAGHRAPVEQRQAAEAIRDAVINDIGPDVVLIPSLFEGLLDDAVISIGNRPTAVLVHDLIPLLFPDVYLTDGDVAEWYNGKIEALKRANLLLTNSECSARDARAHLGFSEGRALSIGSDVDKKFLQRPIDRVTRDMLAAEFGLTRPFVMYTGGIDPRKNIPALISAFAALPKDVVARHQLAIVCQASNRDKELLLTQARAEGLAEDALMITGFVSDDNLITLYNACEAFVFPSWYEGFGLPVLEAMRCGAPVIGAGVASIPEIIGRDDAMFDPHSTTDMARMIEKVLTDTAFRQSLRDSAANRSALFSWDETAQRAMSAMRTLVATQKSGKAAALIPTGKPRLAYVSPLPPEPSGISFYSAELLPALAQHYDIDLIVAQDKVEGVDTARFPLHDVKWLRDHISDYDRVLYQFGNSHFHAHMFDLLTELPGTVVLHDFFLSNIEAHLDQFTFTRILAEHHGYRAVVERFDTTDGRDGIAEAILSWPANARVVHAAEGIIVHSNHARDLARRFYGSATSDECIVIPLLRTSQAVSNDARARARAKLGIAQEELLICSFGYVTPAKLPSRLVDGMLASATALNPKARLVFVGNGDSIGKALSSQISSTPMNGRIRITGWTSNDLYRSYLHAADFAVQLRSASRGESSAAVLDCQNFGLPVIVNAHGSLADFPSETVLRIPDDFSSSDLASAIDRLACGSALRATIGAAAKKSIVDEHAPAKCALAYRDAIEAFHRRHHHTGRGLLQKLAQLPPDDARDAALAQAVADSFPLRARLRQLLVDVSLLAEADSKSGIQRVVRAILFEWLSKPPPGWRVEPVFADAALGRYRYARTFTCKFLNIPSDWAYDAPVDYSSGDQFVGLDLHPSITEVRKALDAMDASGVQISFVVYDLLPMLLPKYFPTSKPFSTWLSFVARQEHLICISRAVADELRAHLDKQLPCDGPMPRISWFHLGADIENSVPSRDLPADMAAQIERLRSRPTFLMVGTVEPRKGHALVLSAFERFWSKSGDANLVIVGKQGWMVEALCERLRAHPEYKGRLIWLDSVSDAHLQRLYQSCDCLIAASEGEGFGLPLIEAAKYDLPILARDLPVFREVAGEHATYFDGSDPDTLLGALEDWLAAHRAGHTVRSGGLPFLTWRESAAALLRNIGIDSAE